MLRDTTILLGCVLLVFVAEASSERIVNTVYRIPLARPSPPKIYRARRDVNDEPLWLYKGDDVNRAPSTADHPYLPTYIDDVKLDPNRRYARSVDSPSARRGGSHSTSSGSRDTGPTHPGYNRRNARSIRMPSPFDPQPSPTFPKPIDPFFPGTRGPGPKPIYPIYARHTRDVLPLKKPTHYDISLPGWNPNARVQPWQKIRVRTGRDIHDLVDVENEDFENEDEIVDLD